MRGAGGRTRIERTSARFDVLLFQHADRHVVLEVGLDFSSSVFPAHCQMRGAGGRTRTYEARRREIYSLLSLPLDDSSLINIISKPTQKSTANSNLEPKSVSHQYET